MQGARFWVPLLKPGPNMDPQKREQQETTKQTGHSAAERDKLLRRKLLEMIKRSEALRQAKPR